MLQKLFARRQDPDEAAARALYQAIVEQARLPAFYGAGGVPDSLDGRFELIILHSALVVRRLKSEGPAAAALSQMLFDVLFQNMDENLREMGVGDMGVGKKIKAMVQAFYGRLSAYEAGLAGGGEALEEALEEALRRNLLGTVESTAEQRAALARYVEACAAGLERLDLDALRAGAPAFPSFPPASPEASSEAKGPRP